MVGRRFFPFGARGLFFRGELLMEDIRLTNWYAKHPIIYRVFIHPRWFSRRISEPSKVCWFQGMWPPLPATCGATSTPPRVGIGLTKLPRKPPISASKLPISECSQQKHQPKKSSLSQFQFPKIAGHMFFFPSIAQPKIKAFHPILQHYVPSKKNQKSFKIWLWKFTLPVSLTVGFWK